MFYYVHLVSGPQGKSALGALTTNETTQVEHGEVAFANAMRPSIDSDSERPPPMWSSAVSWKDSGDDAHNNGWNEKRGC
jgi:hypothetical protein